jgi:hypothetical protein
VEVTAERPRPKIDVYVYRTGDPAVSLRSKLELCEVIVQSKARRLTHATAPSCPLPLSLFGCGDHGTTATVTSRCAVCGCSCSRARRTNRKLYGVVAQRPRPRQRDAP